jgi:hypothetical protein
MAKYLGDNDPADLARKVIRQARPWRSVLADWLLDAGDGAVEMMSRQLTSRGIDPHEIAGGLPISEAADRLHSLTGNCRGSDGIRYVQFASGMVQARADGWYYATAQSNGTTNARVKRISDFTVTIRQVRILPSREVYDCDVYYRGQIYPVELDPRQDIETQLVRSGVGLVFLAPSWGKRILKLAIAFRAPIIVQE